MMPTATLVIINMIWECPFWCGVLIAFNCFPVAVNNAIKDLDLLHCRTSYSSDLPCQHHIISDDQYQYLHDGFVVDGGWCWLFNLVGHSSGTDRTPVLR